MALDGVQCRDLVNMNISESDWYFAKPSDNAMYHATLFAWPVPNTAQGDFDGDKKKDVAFLIERTDRKHRQIAVCLSSKPNKVLFIEPGCSDDISLAPKGYFKTDGISASCAEVTADVWLYKKGTFVMIPGEGD